MTPLAAQGCVKVHPRLLLSGLRGDRSGSYLGFQVLIQRPCLRRTIESGPLKRP